MLRLFFGRIFLVLVIGLPCVACSARNNAATNSGERGSGAGANDSALPTTAPTPVSLAGPELLVADLHHVHHLTSGIYCGSAPETDEEFIALGALGIKTILTVDGSKPNADLAGKHGLRYVHLPVGYDGITRQRELEIGRAVRDLPGPFYIHCHHGLHRGPTGAVVAAMTVAGWTPEQAVAALHAIGTSPALSRPLRNSA